LFLGNRFSFKYKGVANQFLIILYYQDILFPKVDDQDPYMPLSTIERPRVGHIPGPPATAPGSLYHRRATSHTTPPQTPPYHGTINGHQLHQVMNLVRIFSGKLWT